MRSIAELQDLVKEALNAKQYPTHPAELYEPISYLLDLGGKRMRPVLLLMATDLFSGDVEAALDPALGIEVFHNFTLMHDDIMDRAPLRRSRPTVHEKWSESVAILSGDVMLVEAYRLIMQVDNRILRHVLEVFNRTAVGVCEGQQIDMNFESRADVRISEYLEMIRLKTAVLLGGALEIGACIAGAGTSEAKKLYSFGENLGIAFQLQDDLLDVFGDPDKFGKQVGGDILSNKKTFLLLSALERAEGDDLQSLQNWIRDPKPEPVAKITAVTAIYQKLGIPETTEAAIAENAAKAMQCLEEIDVPDERKERLREFAESLAVRKH